MASFYWLYCYYCFPHCIICSYTQYCMLCVTVVHWELCRNYVDEIVGEMLLVIFLHVWVIYAVSVVRFCWCFLNFFFCQDLGKEIAFIRQTHYSESFYAVFCCFLFPLQNKKFWYLPGSLLSVINLVQNLTCWITSSYQVKEN